ncbi:tetratricopeptide repeat protein [Pseudomonas sp. ODNR1LW]|nr:tetratricopeptide repeat protein [Pseudomonas sp. ODNR1LW]
MTPGELARDQQAQIENARALAGSGRLQEGLNLLAPLAARADAPWQALSLQADLLKHAGRLADSAEASRRLVAVRPQSVPARHNLASTLGDMGRAAEAEIFARQALAIGGDAPETWLVLARALQSQNRFDEADTAYRAALQRRPGYADALRDLSQLIWMRTADADAACEPLNTAIDAQPGACVLRQIKARLLEFAGRREDGYAALVEGSLDAAGELAAAQAILPLDPRRAAEHANRAAALAGRPILPIQLVQAETCLALGDPQAALVHVEAMRAMAPHNQNVLALLATAWRMQGDPRYDALYDYEALVRSYRLDTPSGWASLETYLSDLAAALHGLHKLQAHPVGQSLRGGSQTAAKLSESDDPVIVAFFQAVEGPIRRHMEALGTGEDPVRSRHTGRYRIQGSWSVRLRPNGFHADHIHSEGWLSSACHIELPPAIHSGEREGWLRFGAAPGLPDLPAQHYVQPSPGTLVLFPSYMWHGTTPFGGEQSRLTLAFDIVPA